MKRLYILLLLLAGPTVLPAQRKMEIFLDDKGILQLRPRFEKVEFKLPEYSFVNSYTPSSALTLYNESPQFDPVLPINRAERPMDMNILSGAYQPFFNIYTPMLIRVSPHFLDYNETYTRALPGNTFFTVNGLQATWPGSGSVNTVSTLGGWTDGRWTFQGEAFAGRYATPYDRSPGVMGGFTGMASFQATDHILLHAWGRYTMYDKHGKNENMFLRLNPYQPQTNIGTAVQFKVNDNFGFGVGMNVIKNRMTNHGSGSDLMIYPASFRNARIGFSPFF